MRFLRLPFLPLFAVLACLPLLGLADESALAALRAADDARIAAMKTPDRAKLGELLSADLHYAHSNGLVDTKATFIDLIMSGKARYFRFDYENRSFSLIAPDVALMTGRFDVKAVIGEATTEAKLSFLGVWHLEDGHWKFRAWQTCKIPPAPGK